MGFCLAKQTRIVAAKHEKFPLHTSPGDIFRIHLNKRELNPDEFDLQALADALHEFTGAESIQTVGGRAEWAGPADSTGYARRPFWISRKAASARARREPPTI